MTTPTMSPILFEVLRNRLTNINEDAASTLKRVSGSQIAVEANDLNTVIMAPDGRVVACGRYVLIQVASMHLVVADLLTHYQENPGIGPEDQFITNDPYIGTIHQPDVVVAAPIFVDGELVAWSASVVHQSDVGGPTPGGMTYDARSIFDEAIPMAPMKIVEAGVIRADIEREYLIRSRTPELNALDLAGQIAANREVNRQLTDVCRRYGRDVLVTTMNRLLELGERELRARLRSLPDGRWRHVAYTMHHDRTRPPGERDNTYAVRLAMTKVGERLALDFRESSDQAPGASNASRPALANYAMASLLIYLGDGLPWVPGGFWPVVEILSRPGSIVDARWPAGVAMSTSASGHSIRTCINACVARMLEASADLGSLAMASCQSAGGGACTMGGIDGSGRTFATMTLDDISGGGGGRATEDGADSCGFMTSPGAALANVEVNESYVPIRYVLRRELADSAGPGLYRGGVGSMNLIAPHGTGHPINVLSFGQGLQHPCAVGVAGGEPGGQSAFAIFELEAASRLMHAPPAETHLPMPTSDLTMSAGQAQFIVSQGGGGFGDPIERDPEAVHADVLEGLLTVVAARRDYGVVVSAETVDLERTEALRLRIRSDRLEGRAPRPAATEVGGRPFSHAFTVATRNHREWVVCRRCGEVVCDAGDSLYDHAVIREVPAASRAPFHLIYAGSEEFVLRYCFCPHCGKQFDVQIGRRDEPILRAVEPLPDGDEGPVSSDR
jgi:N-methylhydantoinase B